jgi:hypothetical protein
MSRSWPMTESSPACGQRWTCLDRRATCSGREAHQGVDFLLVRMKRSTSTAVRTTMASTAIKPNTSPASGLGVLWTYEMTAAAPTKTAPAIGHFNCTTHPSTPCWPQIAETPARDHPLVAPVESRPATTLSFRQALPLDPRELFAVWPATTRPLELRRQSRLGRSFYPSPECPPSKVVRQGSDVHGVALVTVSGSRDGKSMSTQQAHVVHFREDKLAESWLLASDQAAVDELFR